MSVFSKDETVEGLYETFVCNISKTLFMSFLLSCHIPEKYASSLFVEFKPNEENGKFGNRFCLITSMKYFIMLLEIFEYRKENRFHLFSLRL